MFGNSVLRIFVSNQKAHFKVMKTDQFSVSGDYTPMKTQVWILYSLPKGPSKSTTLGFKHINEQHIVVYFQSILHSHPAALKTDRYGFIHSQLFKEMLENETRYLDICF